MASPYNIIDEVDCNLSRTKIIRDRERLLTASPGKSAV